MQLGVFIIEMVLMIEDTDYTYTTLPYTTIGLWYWHVAWRLLLKKGTLWESSATLILIGRISLWVNGINARFLV